MSRRINTSLRPPDAGKAPAAGAPATGAGKPKITEDYLGRLTKYIPAEIIGLYLFVMGLIPQASKTQTILWVVSAVCWASTPAWMWFATSRNKAKALWWQVGLATLAFPCWVFAIGGPFEALTWYESWMGAAVLAFVTLFFGRVEPAPET